MSGVPLPRLQKLLGHASAIMSLRYAKHSPEAFLDEDAAAVAAHMGEQGDREAEARVEAARREIKRHEAFKIAPNFALGLRLHPPPFSR